jgi:chemotaxis receptor (MCP) glutamine deamidase CheD
MKKLIRIHIGGLHVSRKPAVIETVLGSCVAVCLYDAVERIGGMNHILLPGEAGFNDFDTAARYGNNAMELLIDRIAALGGNRRRIVAKAFGGAKILPSISDDNRVGIRNRDFVLEFLEMEGIDLVGHDLGGYSPRKISFHTDTGHVYLKTLRRLSHYGWPDAKGYHEEKNPGADCR